MRTLNYWILILICTACQLKSQPATLNLDFEAGGGADSPPAAWGEWGNHSISSDQETFHGGLQSVKIEGRDANTFGSCYLKIEPGFSGNKISLSGWIKHEDVSEGHVGLLLRLDGAEGGLCFDNMIDRQVSGTGDWLYYEVSLDYPEKAVRTIFVGGILVGSGTAWFDDFKVKIDGENIATLERMEQEKFPAELDSSFTGGSGFMLENASKKQLERLELLGRVWGYVKYHHVAVAAGKYDMDKELFRLLAKLDDPDFDRVLIDWIEGLGGVGTFEDPETDYLEYQLVNDHDWLLAAGVSSVLQQSLTRLPRPENSSPHYYLDIAEYVGNPVFQHEHTWNAADLNDTGMRLLILFRYWNIIEYFFPYKVLTDTDWAVVLGSYLPLIIEAKTPLEVQQIVFRLIGEVQDTHASMWGKPKEMQDFLPLLRVSAYPKYLDGKMVIARLGEKNDQLALGDIVLAVDGNPTETLIEHYRPYAPASNEATVYRDIGRMLLGTDSTTVTVTVERNGKILELDCAAVGQNWGNWFGDERRPGFELLEDEIGYIYAAGLNKGEIDQVMPNQLDLKGLVVDLRCYPSDFIVFSLGKYLVPKPTPFVKFTRSTLAAPGNFVFTGPISVGDGVTEQFKGKVVILIDEWTQSQAEYTTMALRNAPDAVVIGSTTAGADGNVSGITLPGNIRTSISGLGVFYPDGSPTQRVGIIPDMEVKQTIDGIKEGRDELMEAAITVINQ